MLLRQTPDEYLYHLEALTTGEAKRLWRERIRENWNNQCAYCGSDENLTLDHIHPRSLGGPDTTNNVVCACHACNQDKGHTEWKEWYESQYFYSWERMKSIESWMSPEIKVDQYGANENGGYKAYKRKNICYAKVA